MKIQLIAGRYIHIEKYSVKLCLVDPFDIFIIIQIIINVVILIHIFSKEN